MTDDQRPDPDALLAQIREDEHRAGRGKLRIYFGSSAGVGKTYAMLAAARKLLADGVDVVAGVVETHGRSETAALLDGLPTAAAGADRVPRHASGRVRPRRRAGAQAGADPGRRTRALQRRRLAPPQALAGRGGAAGRRHRRLHHAQRAAPGEPERRGRRHHRHRRARDGARHVLRPGRRGRAGRHAGRRAARAPDGRQGLPAGAGRARGAELLPQGQPDGPARAGAAPHRRPRRRRRAGLPHRPLDRSGLEDRGRTAVLHRPARGRRARGAQRGAAGPAAGGDLACGLCRDAGAAAPRPRPARRHPADRQAGAGAGRQHGRAVRRRPSPRRWSSMRASTTCPGWCSATAIAPLVATANPRPGAGSAGAGHRPHRGRAVAARAARRRWRAEPRYRPQRTPAPRSAATSGRGRLRGHHRAGLSAGAVLRSGQHRHGVPAVGGRGGGVARPRAGGAGRVRQRGGLRLLLRPAAPVVRGHRRAVPADLRGHAGRRSA